MRARSRARSSGSGARRSCSSAICGRSPGSTTTRAGRPSGSPRCSWARSATIWCPSRPRASTSTTIRSCDRDSGMSWALYATQGLHGLVYGMLLFLVSAGLTLVFGMMGILNIAHAAFYMLGAYLAYTTVHVTGNFWLSLLVAPVAVGLLGAAVERGLLRRAHAFGHAS